MAAPGKQYGLILPKKLQQKNVCAPKHSAFADDSDEEMSVGETLQKEALKKRVMKQTKLEMQKALEEDASVYEYDSVYDDMQKKKEDNAAKMLSGKDRKPKYIQNILKAVEHRKKEQEKRMEKKIQKEREMEGEEFQDKEAFVTTAYKKKLLEKAEEEERERREAAIEASLDVMKQRDLSGFYRHLLNQTVGEEKTPECSLRSAEVKQEKPKGYSDEPNNRNQEENIDADSDLETSEDEKETAKKSSKGDKGERKTHYRRRHTSSSNEEEEEDDNKGYKEKSAKTSDKNRMESGKSQRLDYEREHTPEFEERTRHKEHNSKDWDRRRTEQNYDERAYDRSKRDGKREKEHRRDDDDYYEKDGKKHKERIDEGKRRDRSDKDREFADREHHKKQDRHRSDRVRVDRSDRNRSDRENTDNREQAGKDQPDRENRGRAERDRRDSQEGECKGKTEKELEESASKAEIPRDVERTGEMVSSCEVYQPDEQEKNSDSKRKVEETSEDGNASTSKFAKRSNEETVISARDRYLARQIARSAGKTYVEKEED